MVNIINLLANHKQYVVARRVDGELWYWGSYSDRDKANYTALNVGGEVIDTDEEDGQR